MPAERIYVVDRVEHRQVVLVDDQGATFTVAARRLPRGVKEGLVLRVAPDATGVPQWETAVLDEAETARRHAEARERWGRLKRRDPGGDVTL